MTRLRRAYCFQKVDERDETVALHAVAVQVVRLPTLDPRGEPYRLEVEITVTLWENRLEKRRFIIIASATSVTWNSSKKRTLFRSAMLRAMSGSGSLRAPAIDPIPKIDRISGGTGGASCGSRA